VSCRQWIVSVLIMGGFAVHTSQVPSTPSFKSVTRVVSVGVSVLAGRRPVTDLTAEDFVLLDNGVRQTIDSLLTAELPVDVSLLIDTSSSTADRLDRFSRDTVEIASLLRPSDRLRVVTFATDILELPTVLPRDSRAVFSQVSPGGLTSLNDAVVSSLVRSVEPTRRHMVIVFTDGIDTFSATSATKVLEVAKRTDAVMIVLLTTSQEGPRDPGPARPLRGTPDVRGRDLLIEAATVTGGWRGWSSLIGGSIVGAFRDALDSVRASYLLRYRPLGVPEPGWHDITVRLQRPGGFAVRTRRGYDSGSQ
jgi:VWFA-related protein